MVRACLPRRDPFVTGRVPIFGVGGIQAGVRGDGTIDVNAALRALLEGLLNAVMDEQASELGAPRNGYRERSPTSRSRASTVTG